MPEAGLWVLIGLLVLLGIGAMVFGMIVDWRERRRK